MDSCDRKGLGPRLGSVSLSPLFTCMFPPLKFVPPPVIFHHQGRHQSPHQKACLGPSPDPCPNGDPNAPPPLTAASPGEATPFCSRMQGCKRAQGSQSTTDLPCSMHTLLGGWRKGGVGIQCRMEQDGDDLPCAFSTAARSAGRWAGWLAVCHQGPPHAAEGDRTAATGVDGGTEGIFGSRLPPPPVPGLLPTREQGCRGCRGCRRQSQSSSRQALFSTTPLLSAGPDACQAPSPFRHGGSLGETEKRTEVALRRRSAAQTTLCCPT